jgi:hypothetical protein
VIISNSCDSERGWVADIIVEYGNEHSVSVKYIEFLDWTNDCCLSERTLLHEINQFVIRHELKYILIPTPKIQRNTIANSERSLIVRAIGK